MIEEREALITKWREKLDAARAGYEIARAQAAIAQSDRLHIPLSDGGLAFQRATIAETEASRAYRETLRIFTDLTVHGKRPTE